MEKGSYVDYTVTIGLDGRWVTGSCFIPETVTDYSEIAHLILQDAYIQGELEVAFTMYKEEQ